MCVYDDCFLVMVTHRYAEFEKAACACVAAAEIPKVFSGSKMFEDASLQELVKSLILQARSESAHAELGVGHPFNETLSVFFLELLAKVVMANKDRVGLVWDPVQKHLASLALRSEQHSSLLSEHALISILRIGERIYAQDELTSQVITSFGIIERLPENVLLDSRTQIVAGLTSFIKVR